MQGVLNLERPEYVLYTHTLDHINIHTEYAMQCDVIEVLDKRKKNTDIHIKNLTPFPTDWELIGTDVN